MITLEQVKTLINGVIHKMPPWVKPDWDENDKDNPNFIKNRPFYKKDGEVKKRIDAEFLPRKMPAQYESAVTNLAEQVVDQARIISEHESHLHTADAFINTNIANPLYGDIHLLKSFRKSRDNPPIKDMEYYEIQYDLGGRDYAEYHYVPVCKSYNSLPGGTDFLENPEIGLFMWDGVKKIILYPKSVTLKKASSRSNDLQDSRCLYTYLYFDDSSDRIYSYIDPVSGKVVQTALQSDPYETKDNEFVRFVNQPYYVNGYGDVPRGWYMSTRHWVWYKGVKTYVQLYSIKSCSAPDNYLSAERLGLALPPSIDHIDIVLGIKNIDTIPVGSDEILELVGESSVYPLIFGWGNRRLTLDHPTINYACAVKNKYLRWVVCDVGAKLFAYRVSMISAEVPNTKSPLHGKRFWTLYFSGEGIEFVIWHNLEQNQDFIHILRRDEPPTIKDATLPPYSADDEGKTLVLKDGAPTWTEAVTQEAITEAMEASY